jgi:hypothetical protein
MTSVDALFLTGFLDPRYIVRFDISAKLDMADTSLKCSGANARFRWHQTDPSGKWRNCARMLLRTENNVTNTKQR